MSRILIVEDDHEINKLLADFLQKNGYETNSAEDGGKASLLLRKQNFDLVLMDLMLPYKSGEHLIKEFREYSQIPVIVLSAKSMMETRLEVLRLGADDYILKPFDLNEVQVRIEVVLRRSGTGTSSSGTIISCGELCLNTNENSVTYQAKHIALTAKELMLLKLFMEYPQKVYTKANLYESVWNDTYYYEDNTINVHVSNLRSKLKKATGNDYIETVWGIGYRLKGE
ncbi:MAG: response regulator transcription factor [Oscillospiraceae bacterium]|nr:response regulator transcription factor [Oscillospiraceae bacterium]